VAINPELDVDPPLVVDVPFHLSEIPSCSILGHGNLENGEAVSAALS